MTPPPSPKKKTQKQITGKMLTAKNYNDSNNKDTEKSKSTFFQIYLLCNELLNCRQHIS